MREAILKQINLTRASGRVCGTVLLPAVAAMSWNDILFSASARHSQDMASRDYFSHTTPEGIGFVQRLWTEGYALRAAGENIAAGQSTVTQVMASWLGSEGHCQNIMSPMLTEVAVACVSLPATTYGSYWTMDLGTR